MAPNGIAIVTSRAHGTICTICTNHFLLCYFVTLILAFSYILTPSKFEVQTPSTPPERSVLDIGQVIGKLHKILQTCATCIASREVVLLYLQDELRASFYTI